ncbi:MAG: thioredoxin family protein [Halanaeroarchaeum sp.]
MESMEPDPDWDADANAAVVETFAALDEETTVRVWGADWCPDTRETLPALAAALEAAGVDDERVEVVSVDREKNGPGTEEYDVEYIPTVVVERDGERLARFVESADVSVPVYMAERLDADGRGDD